MAKKLLAIAAEGKKQAANGGSKPGSSKPGGSNAVPTGQIAVRAEVRLRNAKMIETRLASGFSQKLLAELAGLCIQHIAALEKFDFSHTKALEHAVRVAGILDIPVESILPESLQGQKLVSRIVHNTTITADRLLDMRDRFQQRFILPSPADIVADKIDLHDELEQVFKTLTYREREIIKRRHGLMEDGQTYTLAEIGKLFRISAERVRAIAAKALRKLQHPVRRKKLEAFLATAEAKGPKTRGKADNVRGLLAARLAAIAQAGRERAT